MKKSKAGKQHKVLDHGYVQLIDCMGSDSSIIEAARMSTGRGFKNWKKDAGLLDFLWRNQHTSPFEMCEVVIEAQAPIFVFREWHRHRTQSYNEFSARYEVMPNLHYVPSRQDLVERIEAAKKTTNKQAASAGDEFDFLDAQEAALGFRADAIYDQDFVYQSYEKALKDGVPKELARINTPGSRYSKHRAKANLLNWFRFLDLRLRPNAQKEIRLYAQAIAKIIKQKFPRSYELFEEYSLHGTKFSRSDMNAIRQLLGAGQFDTSKVKGLFASDSKYREFHKKLVVGGDEVL